MTDDRAELLAGVTVLERPHSVAAAHAGKLLRQLGATVWVEETTGGTVPLGVDASFGWGKRAWSSSAPGRFDVYITDERCAATGQATLAKTPPAHDVRVEIFDFDGAAGPGLSGAGASSLLASCVAGAATAIGRPGQAPLGLPPGVVETVAGSQAVAATLAALVGRTPGDPTTVITLSLNGCLEYFVGINSQVFSGYPREWTRQGRRASGSAGPYPSAIFPCRDGFVGIIGRTAANWEGVLAAMGNPSWADAPGMRDPYEVALHHADEADVYLAAWSSQLTEEELNQLALEHGFIIAPLRDMPEVCQEEHYEIRGFWESGPDGRRVPGLPFQLRRPAEAPSPRTTHRATMSQPAHPSTFLNGIRVLDLSWVWSGPMVSMILADLGADVVKVEHERRADPSRLRGRPVFDGAPVAGPPLEVVPYFHQLNHGKRSIGADLTSDGVNSVLLEVARSCDVVVENMRPGVLDRRGLGYDDLAAANPAIVMLSMSLVGSQGPLSRMRGYAPVMSGLAGLERLMGYPPDDVTGMYTFSFADANAAIYGVIGTLAAIYDRRRSGLGAFLDLSQTEACINAVSVQVAQCQTPDAGRPPVDPNRDPGAAFQAVVRCAGDDSWVSVRASTQDQVEELRRALGVSPEGKGSVDDTRQILEHWCVGRRREDILAVLTERGLAAAPVRTWPEVRQARHAGGRLSLDIPHPYAARQEVFLPPWCFDGRLAGSPRRAPFLAEHTDDVLLQLTSLRPESLTALKARGGIVQREALVTDVPGRRASMSDPPPHGQDDGPYPSRSEATR